MVCLVSAQAQTTQKADLKNLPKGITYEGKVKDAIRYTDSLGDNIVITTQTGAYVSNRFVHETEGQDAELFAYHYLVKNGVATQTWKVYDYVSDCPVDMELAFLKGTFQVTDLDKDGHNEVWLMYKHCCHGDVSPCGMKVIMYEGTKKYAMRGENKVFGGTDDKGADHYMGGGYEFDPAFNGAPAVFRNYAKALWEKNIMQKWDGE